MVLCDWLCGPHQHSLPLAVYNYRYQKLTSMRGRKFTSRGNKLCTKRDGLPVQILAAMIPCSITTSHTVSPCSLHTCLVQRTDSQWVKQLSAHMPKWEAGHWWTQSARNKCQLKWCKYRFVHFLSLASCCCCYCCHSSTYIRPATTATTTPPARSPPFPARPAASLEPLPTSRGPALEAEVAVREVAELAIGTVPLPRPAAHTTGAGVAVSTPSPCKLV